MLAQIQPALQEALMLLAAGYFDESTDGEFEDRVFTVGGYVTAGYPALHLDFAWRDLLNKYDLAYFKASELEAGIGVFAKFRDNPETAATDRFTQRERDVLKSIKIEFVDLLAKQDGILGISATVHMRQLKAFKLDHPELFRLLPPVYQLCGQLVMVQAGYLMNETEAENPPELWGFLRPVFDSHQEYGPRFIEAFDKFCEKNPESSRLLLPPIFEDERNYLCLQAADLFVYEVRRTVSNFFFDPKRDLRIAMKRLFPRVQHTYVLDYDALKMIASGKSNRVESVEETEID